jgi:hypothetical protein
VDSNGALSFAAQTASMWDVSGLPSAAAPNRPNTAVYPFWHDWNIGASSSVRTATVGTAPNRQFIVEWRNVADFNNDSIRASFEVVFFETTGDIAFAYQIDPTYIEQGGAGTVGVENTDGTIAVQYLYRHPALRPGDGLLFHPTP